MKTRTDLSAHFNKAKQLPVFETLMNERIVYTDDYVHWLEDLVLQQVSDFGTSKEKALNLPVVNGSISAGDAIMAILDWMKSDDCWIEDKNGKKITDVEICGKFNSKYLEKYYR